MVSLSVLRLFIFCFIWVVFYSTHNQTTNKYYRRAVIATLKNDISHDYRFKAKPAWVKKEIIRLKALMREAGCRKIADVFNRQFQASHNVTVGKTYVANVIRDHQYQIQVLQKKLKHLPPNLIPKQLIWGVDLTFKHSTQKDILPILGVIEHHSRKSLTLEALKDKITITLLSYLFTTIQKYGKPKIIRTDNEAIFTSTLFSLSLWLLGIKHQTTDIHSPWQNGRVERFFGTLKQKLNQWPVDSFEQCDCDLQVFRFFV